MFYLRKARLQPPRDIAWAYDAENRIREGKLGSTQELGDHGINRDGCPWWEVATGATWESASAGPDGICSRAHLFGSTNVQNSRDSDKDMWYLISWKIKKLKVYYLPSNVSLGRQRGVQKWPSSERSPTTSVRPKEMEGSLSSVMGWIMSPTKRKGCVGWSLKLQYLRMWPHLEIGPLQM